MNKIKFKQTLTLLMVMGLFFTGRLIAAEYEFAVSKRVKMEKVTRDDIPEGVVEIIERLKTDSTMNFGPIDTKGSILHTNKKLTIDDYSFSDIRIGLPIPKYIFKKGAFEGEVEKKKFDDMIEPYDLNQWLIPILAKGEYLYYVELLKNENGWNISGCSYGPSDYIWDRIERIYTEGLNENPVLIKFCRKDYIFFRTRKGKNRILHLEKKYDNKEKLLLQVKKETKGKLLDSKKLIPYWKKELERAGKRSEEFLKRYPGVKEIFDGGGK